MISKATGWKLAVELLLRFKLSYSNLDKLKKVSRCSEMVGAYTNTNHTSDGLWQESVVYRLKTFPPTFGRMWHLKMGVLKQTVIVIESET